MVDYRLEAIKWFTVVCLFGIHAFTGFETSIVAILVAGLWHPRI